MNKEDIEKLGWNFVDYWANRGIYELSKESKFSLFEHNGSWGIIDPYHKGFNPIYCDMSLDNICKFTGLVKIFDDMFKNPKAYTLYQYMETEVLMQDFIKEMKDKS